MKGKKHTSVNVDELHFISVAEIRSPYMDFRRKIEEKIRGDMAVSQAQMIMWEPHPNHHERFLASTDQVTPASVQKAIQQAKNAERE